MLGYVFIMTHRSCHVAGANDQASDDASLLSSIARDVLRQFAHQLGGLSRITQRKIEKLEGAGARQQVFTLSDQLVTLAKSAICSSDDGALISVPRPIAKRAVAVASSLELHRKHCEQLGEPIHTAGIAAWKAKDHHARQRDARTCGGTCAGCAGGDRARALDHPAREG